MKLSNLLPYKSQVMRRSLVVIILTAAVVTVIAVNRRQSPMQASQVVNKTSALQVTSATTSVSEDAYGSVTLTVKNVLIGKSVTGLVVDNGNVQQQIDFLALNDALTTGKSYSFSVPAKLASKINLVF